MPRYLKLRFEAPMMSFGAPIVDHLGHIQPVPGRSMLTGLLGNALGYDHRDVEALEALQTRLVYGVRQDRTPGKLTDYQSVDLGQEHLLDDRAWTTRGALQRRKGSTSRSTHIRRRDYWTDGRYTLVVGLEQARPQDPELRLEQLGRALEHPARPLFLGRKCCPPSRPLYAGELEAAEVFGALASLPRPLRSTHGAPGPDYPVWWTVPAPGPDSDEIVYFPLADRCDWADKVHRGQSWMAHTRLPGGA